MSNAQMLLRINADRIKRLEAEKAELLTALKKIDKRMAGNGMQDWPERKIAQKAIAKAEAKDTSNLEKTDSVQ